MASMLRSMSSSVVSENVYLVQSSAELTAIATQPSRAGAAPGTATSSASSPLARSDARRLDTRRRARCGPSARASSSPRRRPRAPRRCATMRCRSTGWRTCCSGTPRRRACRCRAARPARPSRRARTTPASRRSSRARQTSAPCCASQRRELPRASFMHAPLIRSFHSFVNQGEGSPNASSGLAAASAFIPITP